MSIPRVFLLAWLALPLACGGEAPGFPEPAVASPDEHPVPPTPPAATTCRFLEAELLAVTFEDFWKAAPADTRSVTPLHNTDGRALERWAIHIPGAAVVTAVKPFEHFFVPEVRLRLPAPAQWGVTAGAAQGGMRLRLEARSAPPGTEDQGFAPLEALFASMPELPDTNAPWRATRGGPGSRVLCMQWPEGTERRLMCDVAGVTGLSPADEACPL